MDIEEKILQYGVFAGRRYKEKEKLMFLSKIQEEFTSLGYNTQTLKKEYKRFSGINCYIGDVVNAKNLVIAHYDTPINSFNKNMVFYPFNNKITERELNDKPRIQAVVVVMIGMFIMYFSLTLLKLNAQMLKVVWISITMLMIGVGYIVLRGFPNPVSANLNTSGVVALLDIARKHPKDTAFILTDRECLDNLGDVMVNEALPKTIGKKNVIHLKAIGNGDNIIVAHKQHNQKMATKIANGNKDIKLFQLDEEGLKRHSLSYYTRAVSITVANEFNGVYEIKDVCNANDLKIDYEKYQQVVDMVNKYLS